MVIVLPSGALITIMPRDVAASRSMFVDADSRAADDFQTRAGLQHPLRHLGLAAHEQGVVFPDDCDQFVLAQAGFLVDLDVGRLDQLADAVIADRVGYQHFEHDVDSPPSFSKSLSKMTEPGTALLSRVRSRIRKDGRSVIRGVLHNV